MSKYFNAPFGLNYLCTLDFPHKKGILDRIYGAQLAKQGQRWVKINPKIEWRLDLNDTTQRWIVYGGYENKATMQWIRSLFKTGGTAIETGPNIGQTLIYYVDLADQILAIDPLPAAIDWLEQCIEHNGLTNIQLINAGIADQKSTLSLQVAGAQSTFRQDWYQGRNFDTIEVECLPLDEFADQSQLDHIRFWKLDVEGMDYEAVKGATRLLSNQKIDALYIEITGKNFTRVSELLDSFGYGLFTISEQLEPIPVHEPLSSGTKSYISLPIARQKTD